MCIGEVDAGDKEDAEDCGHQEPKAGRGFADESFFHGLDVGGEGAVGWAVEFSGRNLTG